MDPTQAFRDHESKSKQILFKEREVDSLMNMIYGSTQDLETMDEDDEDGVIDTYRFDVAKEKLSMYRNSAVKRKLKQKFVTGQGQDQIVQNLLNMSDDEGEVDAEKRRSDKEQLRKLE